MLMVAFVQWWYGPGWRDSAGRLSARIQKTYLTFSVPILLRTLFAPWRRITTVAGSSIQDKFRAGVDNLISRIIGMIMRIIVLSIAGFMIAGFAVFGGLILILWPVLPLIGPVLIVAGLLI